MWSVRRLRSCLGVLLSHLRWLRRYVPHQGLWMSTYILADHGREVKDIRYSFGK